MINKRYRVDGVRKGELLYPTGGYIRQAFGNSAEEIRHRIGKNEEHIYQIGKNEEHIYHFGRVLGNTTVVISNIGGKVYVDIIGEVGGSRKTKSNLEKKFNLNLTEI